MGLWLPVVDRGDQLGVILDQFEDTPVSYRFGVRIGCVVQRMAELVASSHSEFQIVPAVVRSFDFQRSIQQDHLVLVVETQRQSTVLRCVHPPDGNVAEVSVLLRRVDQRNQLQRPV